MAPHREQRRDDRPCICGVTRQRQAHIQLHGHRRVPRIDRLLPLKNRTDQVLHVAFVAGDGAFGDARAFKAGGFQGRAHLIDRSQAHCLVAHDAVVGFVVLAFELGLDQADEDGARLREARERGRQGRQAMKLRSATSKSNGAPSSTGSASLMLVRSNTATRGSWRSFPRQLP